MTAIARFHPNHSARHCGLPLVGQLLFAIGVLWVSWVFPSAVAADPQTLAYGPEEHQDLLLYPRPEAQDAPVFVFVHGGAWMIGDKSRVHLKPRWAHEHGAIFVSIGYRLDTETVDVAGQIEDIETALGFVRSNASGWGGNPDRMIVFGHSAGAHLAAMAALSTPGIAGAVLLDGAGYDIAALMAPDHATPWRARRMYAKVFGQNPQAWAALSPVVRAQSALELPPFLIVHQGDRRVATDQSQRLQSALDAAGGAVQRSPLEGYSHRDINVRLGETGAELTRVVEAWLEGIIG